MSDPSVIKMPPKLKGKKSQSSAKSSTAKPTQQKKNPIPKKPPEKTRSPAFETLATAGMKRRQTESSGALCEKRSKTRPLTAADILGIVSAVVKAMPQPAEASTISTPRRSSSRCKQKNTDQLSQATRHRVTGTTLSTEASQARRFLLRRRTAPTMETPTTRILVSQVAVRVVYRFL